MKRVHAPQWRRQSGLLPPVVQVKAVPEVAAALSSGGSAPPATSAAPSLGAILQQLDLVLRALRQLARPAKRENISDQLVLGCLAKLVRPPAAGYCPCLMAKTCQPHSGTAQPLPPPLPHAGAGCRRPCLPGRSLRPGRVAVCRMPQPVCLARGPPPAGGLRRGHRRRQPGLCAAPLQPLQGGQVGGGQAAAAVRLPGRMPAAPCSELALGFSVSMPVTLAPLPRAGSSTRSCMVGASWARCSRTRM